MKHFTHLVCSGSALRSLCLLGVLRYIYFNKMENYIKNAAGSSMGAFFCLAFALKIPVDKLEEILTETIKVAASISSSSILNIFTELGFNDAKNYLYGIKKYIKEKYDMDDITFIQLSKMTGVNVYVSTTRINDGKNIIFNVNDYPNVSVLDAIAASMCIPTITKPIKIDKYLYIDGCISNNLPYDVFKEVNHDNILNIAIYVKSDYEVANLLDKEDDINFLEYYKQITSIIYANSLYYTYISRVEKFKNPLLITESPITTFYKLKVDDNEFKFNILKEDIDNLILQGFTDMTKYMEQFN